MKAIGQYNTLVRFYPTVKGALTELMTKEVNFFTEVGFPPPSHPYWLVHVLMW